MEPVPVPVQNSWQLLSGDRGQPGRGGKGGRGGGRGGGGRGGGVAAAGTFMTAGDAIAAFKGARGGASARGMTPQSNLPPTANTDNADAAQSWNTYQNRSNLQKARREGGVRTLTIDEAVNEINAKSQTVHTNNIGGRSSLWGQWCRRMEDSRLDSDCKYVDPAQDGTTVTFDEIFLRSRALEDAVGSVLRFPSTDETELAFLFSHCLEGDALLHQKIADGVKVIGDCFRESNRTIPEDFVEQMLAVVSALKVKVPALRRNSGQALHRLDEQIAFQMAKLQELTREGSIPAPDVRHRCTAELVRLGVEKHKLLVVGAPQDSGGDATAGEDCLADEEQVKPKP
jgi:hypothetical protein